MSSNVTKLENSAKGLPLILAVNSGGTPIQWISYERSAYYYAKNKVLWSLGEYKVVLHGGNNAKTGLQSILTMDTIIAVDNKHSPFKQKNGLSPTLSNKTLFERDRHVCAYCGGKPHIKSLTRDHILPTSRDGKDTWDNCVTSCKACNNWKGDKTLKEAEMQLLYVPYTPSYNEHLILQNRKILTDQMTFLMSGVSKHSRVVKEFLELNKGIN